MRTDVRLAYDRDAVPSRVVGLVVGLAGGLRRAGAPVSTGETIDAVRALAAVDLADRAVVRSALRGTLLKDDAHDDVFDRLFDLLFPRPLPPSGRTAPARPSEEAATTPTGEPGSEPAAEPGGGDLGALRQALADALRHGDQQGVADLLAASVDRWSGVGDQDRTQRHHVQRVLRPLGLDQVLRALMRGEADREDLDRRLDASEAAAVLAEVRRLVEELVAQRMAERLAQGTTGRRDDAAGDPDRPDRGSGRDGLEDLPILRAGPDELAALRAAVRPLARRLATRLGRRRRRGRGSLDMRRTLRASMSSGGVPLSPALRQRSPSKPDIVVLCDVSGSVAQFAPFTLALLHALHAEFHRVRSWVFIDGIVEITDLLDRAPGVLDAHHLLGRRGLVSGDGRSDYARALGAFLAGWRDVVTPKTTVIMVGDARSHDRTPAIAEVAELHRQSRRLYWLNPEPAAEWDGDDSLMSLYGTHCHGVYEVSTLRQLGECVASIA